MLGRTVSAVVAAAVAVLVTVGLLAPAAGSAPVTHEPPDPLVIGNVRHRVVPVDRWSWVAIHVRLLDPGDRLRVWADGPDLRTRGQVLRDVDEGRSWIRVPVRLSVPRDRYLTARVRATFDDDGDRRPAQASIRVGVEPRR